MIDHKEYFETFIEGIEKLITKSEDDGTRREDLYKLMSQLFVTVSNQESLYFSTLFAMISYVCARYSVDKKLRYHLHHFRRSVEQHHENAQPGEGSDNWENSALAVLLSAGQIFKQEIPGAILKKLPKELSRPAFAEKKRRFLKQAKVLAHAREEHDRLKIYDEATPGDFALAFNEVGRNDLYYRNIESAIDKIGFPFTLSLIDIEIDEDGIYHPRVIVLEPDFLLDITAIANCFQVHNYEARSYILNKFISTPPTAAIMQGHVSNYFLDELIHDPDIGFMSIFPKVFKLNPLAFTLFDDETVLKIMQKAKLHFNNLRNTIREDWPKLGIRRETSFLEPSFYSAKYGIQGRLDVFHVDGENTDIVELKSGKLFMPNVYGLNQSHYAQTLLYDLLIKSVRSFKVETKNYILYSNELKKTMRFAPVIDSIQREAIQLRNELYLIEKSFSALRAGETETFLERMRSSEFKRLGGYMKKNVEAFEKSYSELSTLEQKYFTAFSGFIAREHHLAKTGVHGMDTRNGLASLWLDSLQEKEDKFNVFQDLTVSDISAEEALVNLNKGKRTNGLANFRVGDIAVLYPNLKARQPVLKTQIYKCTVTALEADHIVVKLRNKQVNYRDLQAHQEWLLEHDLLDSSFNGQFRSLFDFISTKKEKRDKFLGISPPNPPDTKTWDNLPEYLSASQTIIFNKMLNAREYFLLWGPPGTGKTSLLLKGLVDYHLKTKKTRILLLAYTNRAVDEICEAVEGIGSGIKDVYFRIGSRVSTKPKFREQLLDQKIAHIRKRKDLVDLIKDHQVVISTIASIISRKELFKIVDFEIALIDEASQILEPALAGLLTNFSKYILIGDHKQLPAVVTQHRNTTVVRDDGLKAIGLVDMRDSYFERMYLLAQEKNWNWVTGSLHIQGRMHEDIMKYPSALFYDGQLQVLPDIPGRRSLRAPWELQVPETADSLSKKLAASRMIFIPAPADEASILSKTSDPEAVLVEKTLGALKALYSFNNKSLDLLQVGIITPFRAQIANIRETLLHHGHNIDGLTIDTVERYQGGARNIIILSLSVGNPTQLNSVISLSAEGVDRKLNVAVTRAREQFILIANPEMIRRNRLYRALMDSCVVVEE